MGSAAYPILLDLQAVPVLVVGGGSVAVRKVAALVECGGCPTVVAPAVNSALEAEAAAGRIVLDRRPYRAGEAAGFRLVFAATDDAAVNAGVAEEAEAVLLSTCNRTELYFAAGDLDRADSTFRSILADRVDLPLDRLNGYLYLHRDRGAVRHLFRVAGGLDSMVLGEPQIQGQVREAYQLAQETRGLAGPVVGRDAEPTLSERRSTSVGGYDRRPTWGWERPRSRRRRSSWRRRSSGRCGVVTRW
jgi:hypothetical protein